MGIQVDPVLKVPAQSPGFQTSHSAAKALEDDATSHLVWQVCLRCPQNLLLQIPDLLLKVLAWHRVNMQQQCCMQSWYLMSSGHNVLCRHWRSSVLVA